MRRLPLLKVSVLKGKPSHLWFLSCNQPPKGTLAIIKDGFINVNASGLAREGVNVYLLENKGFFLTG
jgi:hypothetical protein